MILRYSGPWHLMPGCVKPRRPHAVLQLYDARSEPYVNKSARLLKKFFKIEGFALRLPSGLVTASTYFSRPSP